MAPYFLGPGRHASEDIPRMVGALAEAHPELRIRVGPPSGPTPWWPGR